jgi:hypothetical protein
MRKLHGGHWELWYVDCPVNAQVWHDVPRCSKKYGERPTCICRGRPTCEDYT